MRTNEFVTLVNKIDGLKCFKDDSLCNGGLIEIIRDNHTAIGIAIPVRAKNMLDLRIDTYLIPDDKKDVLLELINSYLSTPLYKRLPEKKYRLRWLNDKNSAENYLDTVAGAWSFGSKIAVHQYTETEIKALKKANPKYATVIDMLKEEVKDDE